MALLHSGVSAEHWDGWKALRPLSEVAVGARGQPGVELELLAEALVLLSHGYLAFLLVDVGL